MGPAVAASAHQSHRVAAGGGEERRGQRGAPVDEQGVTGEIGQAESADVQDLPVLADQTSQTQVEAEASQGSNTRAELVDLHVAVDRSAAFATGFAS